MSESRSIVDSPEWPSIVETSTRAALQWLPADALERLQVYTSPSYIRRARRRERDATIRELATHYTVYSSGRAMASRIARDLGLYCQAGGLDRPAPTDPRRALLHRVLELSGGHAIGWRVIFAALAGLGECAENSADSCTRAGV